MLLKNIIKCSDDCNAEILRLRNIDVIRSNMYSDHVIDVMEHRSWLEKLKLDKNNIVFAVIEDGAPKGVLSINNINAKHATADWAFYLSPSTQGRGIGAALEYTALEYVFNDLNLQKLNCQVLDFNVSVIQMHEKFGFQREGVLRSQIKKTDERVDVVLLGITKDEWQKNRESKAYVLDRLGQQIRIEV